VAAGGPLGPVQRNNLLIVSMQEPGQPGAVATGARNRPHPLAWLLARQLQQLLVASWAAGTVTCWITAPVAATTTAAVCVCWWVSTPTGELDDLGQHGHRVDSVPGRRRGRDWSGPDARQNGDGTPPTSLRVVRLLDQASSAGSGPHLAAVGGQVRAGPHQGQPFQASRPPPPIAARIITEPRAVSQSFHQALLQPTRPHSTECLPDLTCPEQPERRERKIGSYLLTAGCWFESCKGTPRHIVPAQTP
jgi:hypothetical protein